MVNKLWVSFIREEIAAFLYARADVWIASLQSRYEDDDSQIQYLFAPTYHMNCEPSNGLSIILLPFEQHPCILQLTGHFSDRRICCRVITELRSDLPTRTNLGQRATVSHIGSSWVRFGFGFLTTCLKAIV